MPNIRRSRRIWHPLIAKPTDLATPAVVLLSPFRLLLSDFFAMEPPPKLNRRPMERANESKPRQHCVCLAMPSPRSRSIAIRYIRCADLDLGLPGLIFHSPSWQNILHLTDANKIEYYFEQLSTISANPSSTLISCIQAELTPPDGFFSRDAYYIPPLLSARRHEMGGDTSQLLFVKPRSVYRLGPVYLSTPV